MLPFICKRIRLPCGFWYATAHLSCDTPTPHGVSRLVQAMSAWSMKTRRVPSRHGGEVRVGTMVMRLPRSTTWVTSLPSHPRTQAMEQKTDFLHRCRPLTRFARDAYPTDENPTCSVPVLLGCEARVYGHATTAYEYPPAPPRRSSSVRKNRTSAPFPRYPLKPISSIIGPITGDRSR